MPNLVRVGGVLLREPGGALARGIDCCCVDDPPCANCCFEITPFGTFNGDGDLIQQFVPDTTIKIVMPTKNSRVVCDGETIDVVIIRHNYLQTVPPPVGTPYVRWDRMWKYVSHTPAVGTGGIVYEDGLVEWGTVTPPVETFSVTLEFDKCWADNVTQFGDIEAGMRTGDYALIYGTSCDSTACCDPVYPCDDCCWYLSPLVADNTSGAFELNDAGDPVFWAQNANGDRMKVTVDGTNNGVWCVGDPAVTLLIKLIPLEYTGATWYPKVSVTASDNWQQTGYTPAIGNGTVVDGPDPPMAITWGSTVGAVEYSVTMDVPCPRSADATITVSFADKYPTGADGGTVSFEWICCSAESPDHSCDDCYPEPNRLCCTLMISNFGTIPLQDIRDFVSAGGFELNAEWRLVFARMIYDAESGVNAVLLLHFVACSFDAFEIGEDCAGQSAALAVASDTAFGNAPTVLDLTPPTDCFSDFDYLTWGDGELSATANHTTSTYETLLEDTDNFECDPCPPP